MDTDQKIAKAISEKWRKLRPEWVDISKKSRSFFNMKTVTIFDLKYRWPEVEKLLRTETEILVTRHSKPLARLVRVEQNQIKRSGPEKHLARIRKSLATGSSLAPTLQ